MPTEVVRPTSIGTQSIFSSTVDNCLGEIMEVT